MKSFFSIIFFLFIGSICYAQQVYQIKADSVRIYNTCDTAELILENRTQHINGFLYNKGAGRTEFQQLKLKAVSPSRIAILGQDTLDLSTLSGIGSGSLQDVTTVGNRTLNEMLITGNALSNTDKGLHLSFDPVTNSSKIINVDVNGNPNTTLINMDLHNLEFFTQTGYRILGLNDQQSAGLAGANFNCRVRGESALLNNEFPILGQMIDSINAHTKDVAPGNIPLSTVLLNGSQANNNINLGASGQTTQYGLNVTRTIGGTDYKATYAINAAGSAYMGVASGASTRVIDVPAALTYARYSSDGGATYYQIWDANTHPAGNAVSPTLTGANVLASLSVNSAGHITGATTRALLASDISAAPASGSANYIQNQTTAAQSGVGFWTAGNGIANSLRTTAPIGQGDILLFNGGGITNANLRWAIYKRTAETGTGNVGSDFAIGRYTDAGALIDNPLGINRSTGEVALGTINNEATDVDKFLVSNGGVLRYRTGAQTLVDIGAAPLSGAGNYIQNGTTAQTANFNITGNGTFGSLASFGGGLQYTNATSNLENFGTAGVNVPSFTTRSAGTKTVWYNALSGTQADFATGVATGVLWNTIPQANLSYRFGFFGGTSEISQLFGDGSQIWAKSGRFTGWGGPANSGPAAEIGVPGGYAIFAGIDRTGTATYYPTILRGGSGTSDPTGKDFRIDASGYGFMAIPNYGAIGTNASGYLINTAGNFIQNQTTAAQSGTGFWTGGTGTANRFQSVSPVASTNGDVGFYEGTALLGANQRWRFIRSTAEATGNVGNNLLLQALDNTGNLLSTPLSINRSSGEVTLGTINNETTDVDKFLVSNSGAIRYRTGAQALSDIGAAPLSGGSNYIQNGTTAQTANFNITGNGTFGSIASFAGGIQLTNGTSNLINYSNFGVVAPTFITRSAGTKLVYYSTLSTAAVDYATGVETSHIWNSVPIYSNTVGFKWYGGTTPVARLDGLGSLELVGQGRFRGWYTANGTGPAAELGFSGGVAALYGFDRTAGTYTTLRLGGGSTATGRYFDIDGTGYKFTNLPSAKILGTDGLGYVVDNSGAFIQNGTGVQAAANFNISGFGTAAGYSATQTVANGAVALDMYEGVNTGANIRWRIKRMNAEATGDVGNDFSIDRFSNTGGAFGSAFSIKRSSGVVTTPQGLVTPTITATAFSDLYFNNDGGSAAYRFNSGGSEKVTITSDGILSVGNSTPSSARAAMLQVQGNAWATDAWVLGTGSGAPIAEFGLSGSTSAFVRTLGTGNITFQTGASNVRATVNGTTGNFEITNQVKISGGTPGAGKTLTSDASGLATWSSARYAGIKVINGSVTAAADDYTFINRASTGSPVITLPSASANTGRMFLIVEEAANPTANGVTWTPAAYDRGNAYTSFNTPYTSQFRKLTLQSDGTNWIIVTGSL